MSYFACFSTAVPAVSAISFAGNGYTLHRWLSLAQWLLCLSVVLMLAISARKRMQRRLPAPYASTQPNSLVTLGRSVILAPQWVVARLRLRSSTIRTRTRHKGRATAAMMLAAIMGAGLFIAGSYMPRYPVYEYHNVAVLEKVAPHKFWLSKSDGEFLFNDCDDDNWLVPGYIIAKFRYE